MKQVENKGITIAAKCAPEEKVLRDIQRSGLEAVELYLSKEIMSDLKKIVKICKKFPFRYALHAPNDCYNPKKLAELTDAISPEIVNFHNIYWEDEWGGIIHAFKKIKTKLCLENIYTLHEAAKLTRRYNLGSCLDLEHLQMECNGVYEEEFIRVLREAAHIHLTGYIHGSGLWHTHIHHSPKHARYMLNLLSKANYSGLVVSEARVSLQNYREFKRLKEFYKKWSSNHRAGKKEGLT